MKKLYISSDDFGMTQSVNEGIRLAYKKDMLSSTNLMVPCPWFEQAAHLALGMSCDIGIHLTLTSEWQYYRWRPLLGKSLADSDGYCYKSIESMMANANREDIRNECRAQIEMVLKKGIKLSYIDLHMCIPSVSGVMKNSDFELELMEIVSNIAKEYSLPYSYELDSQGMLEHFNSGLSVSSKDYDQVEKWLSNLGPGTHHLSCHCSVDSYEQSSIADPTDGNYNWALIFRRSDMRLILSEWFINVIKKNNISIIKNKFISKKSENILEKDMAT